MVSCSCQLGSGNCSHKSHHQHCQNALCSYRTDYSSGHWVASKNVSSGNFCEQWSPCNGRASSHLSNTRGHGGSSEHGVPQGVDSQSHVLLDHWAGGRQCQSCWIREHGCAQEGWKQRKWPGSRRQSTWPEPWGVWCVLASWQRACFSGGTWTCSWCYCVRNHLWLSYWTGWLTTWLSTHCITDDKYETHVTLNSILQLHTWLHTVSASNPFDFVSFACEKTDFTDFPPFLVLEFLHRFSIALTPHSWLILVWGLYCPGLCFP